MRAIVLGSAAGGGFPQWNCGCENCVAGRRGARGFEPRTQDSVAVTADGQRFVLLNASPDVHAQIANTRVLHPRSARHSPISAIVLTNGDLDHVLGLFSLRESQPLAVYATRAVWSGLEASVFIRTLRRFEGQLVQHTLELGKVTPLVDASGAPLGLDVRAFPLAGKLPVHLVGHGEPSPEDNVGVVIGEPGKPTIAYAAAFASLDGVDLSGHAAVLADGTFFSEDELVRQGLSRAVAKDMAHLPVRESLPLMRALSGRKIYTHVNNTNPMLSPFSEERRIVDEAGCQVAFDGLEIET